MILPICSCILVWEILESKAIIYGMSRTTGKKEIVKAESDLSDHRYR